jgi:hypothetical protein
MECTMPKTLTYPDVRTEHGIVEVRAYRQTKYTDLIFDFIFWPRQVRDERGQDALIDRLGAIASDRCFEAGKTGTILRTSGPTIWSMTVPNGDADTVVDAVTAYVTGDDALLLDLIGAWNTSLEVPALVGTDPAFHRSPGEDTYDN